MTRSSTRRSWQRSARATVGLSGRVARILDARMNSPRI